MLTHELLMTDHYVPNMLNHCEQVIAKPQPKTN